MPSQFSNLFRRRLLALDVGIREFARRTGMSAGHISRIATGHEAPPQDELARWATLLELQGQQREVFIREGLLTHTPRSIAAEYRRLRRLVGRLAPGEIGGQAESAGDTER